MLGWSAALPVVSYPAGADVIREGEVHGFLADQPGVALAVATTLAARLERITGYLADLRHQYSDRADQLGMVDAVLESLTHHQHPADPGSDREPDAPY